MLDRYLVAVNLGLTLASRPLERVNRHPTLLGRDLTPEHLAPMNRRLVSVEVTLILSRVRVVAPERLILPTPCHYRSIGRHSFVCQNQGQRLTGDAVAYLSGQLSGIAARASHCATMRSALG